MKKECEYVKEIKKKLKLYGVILIILICIVGIEMIYKIPWNLLIELFKNDNGNFSNEVLWTSIGSVGSILAFIGVIITIKCSEKTRFKQNQYEYYKNQKEEEELEFEREVKKQLDILNPINAIEIMTTVLNDNNYNEINNLLTIYICKIKRCYINIHWYNNNLNINGMKKYNEFGNLLCKKTDQISKIITCYTSYVTNWYLKNSIYKDLKKIDSQKALENDEKKEYETLKSIYDNPQKSQELIDTIGKYTMELVEISNNEMFILQTKAKEMIQERRDLIKEELENIR